jgi:hypothetical protein
MEWFANKGQIIQVTAAVVSVCLVLASQPWAGGRPSSLFVLAVALGWLAFSVIMFFRVRSQKTAKVGAGFPLTVQDVVLPLERSTSPTVNFKSKLRIVLKNESGHDLNISSPRWIRETGDVSIQPLDKRGRYLWQLEGPGGWEANAPSSWQSEELPEIHLRHGDVCRTWIGLDSSVSDHEARRTRLLSTRLTNAGTDCPTIIDRSS